MISGKWSPLYSNGTANNLRQCAHFWSQGVTFDLNITIGLRLLLSIVQQHFLGRGLFE